MAGKGVVKEPLLQIISLTAHVAIFRGGCPTSSSSVRIARMGGVTDPYP